MISMLYSLAVFLKKNTVYELKFLHNYLRPHTNLQSHPGSGSDRTIASERQNTALATLYIGGSVTCSQKKTQGA